MSWRVDLDSRFRDEGFSPVVSVSSFEEGYLALTNRTLFLLNLDGVLVKRLSIVLNVSADFADVSTTWTSSCLHVSDGVLAISIGPLIALFRKDLSPEHIPSSTVWLMPGGLQDHRCAALHVENNVVLATTIAGSILCGTVGSTLKTLHRSSVISFSGAIARWQDFFIVCCPEYSGLVRVWKVATDGSSIQKHSDVAAHRPGCAIMSVRAICSREAYILTGADDRSVRLFQWSGYAWVLKANVGADLFSGRVWCVDAWLSASAIHVVAGSEDGTCLSFAVGDDAATPAITSHFPRVFSGKGCISIHAHAQHIIAGGMNGSVRFLTATNAQRNFIVPREEQIRVVTVVDEWTVLVVSTTSLRLISVSDDQDLRAFPLAVNFLANSAKPSAAVARLCDQTVHIWIGSDRGQLLLVTIRDDVLTNTFVDGLGLRKISFLHRSVDDHTIVAVDGATQRVFIVAYMDGTYSTPPQTKLCVGLTFGKEASSESIDCRLGLVAMTTTNGNFFLYCIHSDRLISCSLPKNCSSPVKCQILSRTCTRVFCTSGEYLAFNLDAHLWTANESLLTGATSVLSSSDTTVLSLEGSRVTAHDAAACGQWLATTIVCTNMTAKRLRNASTFQNGNRKWSLLVFCNDGSEIIIIRTTWISSVSCSGGWGRDYHCVSAFTLQDKHFTCLGNEDSAFTVLRKTDQGCQKTHMFGGHISNILGIASRVDAGEGLVVTVGSRETVAVWRVLLDGTVLLTGRHSTSPKAAENALARFFAVAFANEGTTAAVASSEGNIRFFDIQDGVREVGASECFESPQLCLTAVGQGHIAAGDRSGSFHLGCTAYPFAFKTFRPSSEPINNVTCLPEEGLIFIGYDSCSVAMGRLTIDAQILNSSLEIIRSIKVGFTAIRRIYAGLDRLFILQDGSLWATDTSLSYLTKSPLVVAVRGAADMCVVGGERLVICGQGVSFNPLNKAMIESL